MTWNHWLGSLSSLLSHTAAGNAARSASTPRKKGRKPAACAVSLEPLESRIAPVVRLWSGASLASGNWSDAANWVSGVAPQADDNLVFSAGAAHLTNLNDFAA